LRKPSPRQRVAITLTLLTGFCALAPRFAQAGTEPVIQMHETAAQHAGRMAWWRAARFGMFIHWGVFSVAAGQWKGKDVPGHGEWLMNKAAVPVDDYATLAGQFNPTHFGPDAWVALARAAGMKYMVITTKHHDGFAMFQSSVSPFNIVAATPFKRDPLKELAAACAKQGMKLGFYYSQSQDWHHKGGAGNNWDPSQAGDYDTYLDTIAVPQVRELLSNYGPIAVLWYDTPRHMTPQRAARFLPLHALQPGLIFNNRLKTIEPDDTQVLGDTETPEQFIPPTGYPGKDWETCMTMNDSWGFKKNDHNWKSTETLLHNLSDIASKGGNFLLNVGPTATGEIPPESIERLQAIGAWLARNGAAIYDTQAGPFPCRLPWGRTTLKPRPAGGVTLFLHIWNWPADGKLLLPGMHTPATGGHLLAGGAALAITDSPAGLVVQLPGAATDSPIAVAVLDFPGPVSTSQAITTVGTDGRITLSPLDAELFGADDDKPQVDGAGASACITHLTQPHWKVQYAFVTPAEKIWAITAEVCPGAYNRLVASAPGPFGRSVTTALQAWGNGPGSFTTVELGFIRLPAGTNALELKSEMEDLRALEIRRIWLTPLR